MTLNNQTRYDTESLVRFFYHGLDALRSRIVKRVVFKYSPSDTYTGEAFTTRRAIILRVPKNIRLSIATLALLFEHEIAHLHGMEHHEMPTYLRYLNGRKPRWARGFKIPVERSQAA
jgi:hypothetical protein